MAHYIYTYSRSCRTYTFKPKFANSIDFFKKYETRNDIGFQKTSYFLLHSSFLSKDP